MQTRVLDECTIPFVLDDAGRTTDEKKKLTDLLLDIFNGGGIANCQRMSKSTTSPIITMNDWVLADLNSDKAVISRAAIIPFLKVERNPVADQTLYEKALDDAMKDASRSVLDAAGFANEKGALRQYFRNVVYQFGIKPFQLEDDEDDTTHHHLAFLDELVTAINGWPSVKVKTILISKSSWRDNKESVPAIALRLKECLMVLEKNGIPHPPENLLRKTIRQNCLGATNNTSQWFNKKGLVLLESQHMTSRKDKEQKVCIYIRRSVLQEDLLQKLDKACGEEPCSETTGENELPSVTTVIEELPSVTTVIEELPSVTTGENELPSVTTVIEELPNVTTGENKLPSVTTVIEELPSVTTGEDKLTSMTTEDAAQNVNLPEVQNPPQGQNAPAADQNANAAGQPLECIPTMEERLKKLEDQGKANSVAMALQSLHRTLDKARFDADEALADLETLVRQAKVNNDPKAREFECVLDEVQRHSKTLSRTALKDLFVALVGDPVKSKILEKANKVLKNIGTLSDNPRPPAYNHGGPQPLMDLNNHGHPWPDRATASRRLPSWRENRRSPYARRPNMAQLACFLCNSESHFARNCPQRTKRQ
ncbi:hypothetical protein QZH41_003478 [Actinostola sp. cb2023]|nr:hypothetical protein QZH41_003478 [Actinostola sp. cb2023]